MAAKGSLEAIIEVAKKEVGTIEGPKDNETKYICFLVCFYCGSKIIP
jgi:hypothetical protein